MSLVLISFYQKTLSRDHGLAGSFFPGKSCRFFPTCSQYTYEAISRFGFIKGGWMGVKRILKCHPWSEGGYDPVEKYRRG